MGRFEFPGDICTLTVASSVNCPKCHVPLSKVCPNCLGCKAFFYEPETQCQKCNGTGWWNFKLRQSCFRCNGFGALNKICSCCNGLGDISVVCDKCRDQKFIPVAAAIVWYGGGTEIEKLLDTMEACAEQKDRRSLERAENLRRILDECCSISNDENPTKFLELMMSLRIKNRVAAVKMIIERELPVAERLEPEMTTRFSNWV